MLRFVCVFVSFELLYSVRDYIFESYLEELFLCAVLFTTALQPPLVYILRMQLPNWHLLNKRQMLLYEVQHLAETIGNTPYNACVCCFIFLLTGL
jgi:hypothetical protein